MSFFTPPRFRVQDAEGNAIVGAKVYFYEAGTTTLKYTGSSVYGPANTNPVITDSAGWTSEIWMLDELYDITITDADDVVLNTYSSYKPNFSSPIDRVVVSSSGPGTVGAVEATNTSSGIAVKAVNSGTGHALWVEADTSAPAKAALHVVPQDNFPSSPVSGDIVHMSKGGVVAVYDGVVQNRLARFVEELGGGGTLVTTGAGSLSGSLIYTFQTGYFFPSGYSLVNIEVVASVGAQVGGPDIEVQLLFNGVVVGSSVITTADVGDCAIIKTSVLIASTDQRFSYVGISGRSPTFAAISHKGGWASQAVDLGANPAVFQVNYIRTGGTSTTMNNLSMTVSVA